MLPCPTYPRSTPFHIPATGASPSPPGAKAFRIGIALTGVPHKIGGQQAERQVTNKELTTKGEY